MNWKKIKLWLPIFGIIIFFYLIIRLDINLIFKEINLINYNYLFLVLLIIPFFYILQTIKWFIIAKKQGINITFNKALKVNLISNFYGFITPGKLGTAMRADYLRDENSNFGKGLGNFTIDKILDLFSLFILTSCFGFLLLKNFISFKLCILIFTLFFILLFLFLIFYKKKRSEIILKFLFKKKFSYKFKEKSKKLFDSFYDNLPKLKFIFVYFLFNLITWIVNYLMVWIIGLSLNINIGFIYFLAILPIATLVAQIPITIDGFGTREITLIALFGIFGLEGVKIFSMSIISIILINVIPSIIAIILILLEQKNELYKVKRSR